MTQIKTPPEPAAHRVDTNQTYQNSDAEVVDYQLWTLRSRETSFVLRGPQPADFLPGQYIASLGPAFTFGRFAPQPYPELLGQALGLASLNLGIGGIGPSFHTDSRHQVLIDFINRSRLATILIFSGRSQSTSRFQVHDYYQEQYFYQGRLVPADYVYQQLLETAPRAEVVAQVTEIRERFVEAFVQLLTQIRVPKVLLWVSKRQPDYQESYDGLHQLLSNFPQLVNQPMVDQLRPHCEAYVEYRETPGLPQQLRHRLTREPVSIKRKRLYEKGKIRLTPSLLTHNHYYPSPEMHQEIAQKLAAACRPLL